MRKLICALMVASCAALVLGEVELSSDDNLDEILKQINYLYGSAEYKVIQIASSKYDRTRSRFHKLFKDLSLDNSLAKPLINVYKVLYRSKPLKEVEFNKVYDEYVTQVCKQVIDLNNRFNQHLDQHPDLETGSNRLERLPKRWSNAVRVCEDQSQPGELAKVFNATKAHFKSKWRLKRN